ncbi:hypothetical protein XA68_10047 [Ophiocordyceps unilateralis]|uniref:Major facilitator superfamily (MFS) profile domain-containing protein n=1 Tax=Ophiocordyceps unilateralis TaxID=268505 RepID=A0A2A9PRN1_OPHUN|nr:hypothetical protein XA68_10047 [Ophiocordyceps unilateralis]
MTESAQLGPKLPVQQLVILVVARLAEPLAYTSIYPYLPEMIGDFGIPQVDIARWAGLITAVFAVSQGLAAVPWGRASDRYGRKPIVLCGLASTMICFLIWGMSTSLTMAIVARAIQGAGSGNVAIIRTIVAEIVPVKELQPRAFSIMPLVWSIGSVVGPAFGGFFAQPASKYPDWFGQMEFFRRFPYALPNLIATIFFLFSATTTFLFLEESLSSKRGQPDVGLALGRRLTRLFSRNSKAARTPLVDAEAPSAQDASHVPSQKLLPSEPPPGMKEVFKRQTIISLVAYTITSMHSVSFDQNVTVFLNYPVMEHTPDNTRLPFCFNGGFGLKSGKIGIIFAIYGTTCGLIQFFLYPPLCKRFGVLKCWQFCSIAMPFIYFITPYASLFPTQQSRLTAMVAVLMLKGLVGIIAFPCITILFTNSCTSTRILGTVNGFATAFSGFARALGPASTGFAFTWGAKHGCIAAAYYFLALVAALGAIPGFMVEDGDGPSAEAEPINVCRPRSESESTAGVDDLDDSVNTPLLAAANSRGYGARESRQRSAQGPFRQPS